MLPFRFLPVLIVLAITACSSDSGDSSQPAASNPAPAASGIDTGAVRFAAQCDLDLALAGELLGALEAFDGVAATETVLDPYNDLLVVIFNGSQRSSLMFNVHPDEGVRDAAAECEQRFTTVETRLELSRPVFEAISAVDITNADEKTMAFVQRKLRDFRLKGVDKDEDARLRILALDEEITALGQAFDRNIAEDVRSITVDSAEDLAGMPEDWIAAHPPGEDGRIRITTDYPDYIPFLRYAERDDLRRALSFEFQNRGYPMNEVALKDLIERRWEISRLQGFDNWADQSTADKMIGNAAAAAEFIEAGSSGSETRALEDYSELLERLQQIEPDAESVELWQSSWLADKIRKEKYGLSSDELRPYFNYDRVRDGILELTSDMYGVEFRRRESAETWHEDVEAWELLDDGEVIGRFYLDMHPRDNKYKHAAHFYYKAGLKDRLVPESALVCNFPGGPGESGIMEKDQVETFLHEFGHLMHYLFRYHQPWLGISQPERDFIEAPSMMLEEWIYDPETLQRFAVNDDGQAIPTELVDKMRAARNFGEGLFVHRQMFLAAVSLNFYNRDPATFELEPLFRELEERYSIFRYEDGTHMYNGFGHLNNYSAFYYTYMWSLAIASDMFTRFQDEGMRNSAVSRDYRRKVLDVGGSKPAAEFVGDFLGRPYNFEAFEKRLNSAD